MTSPAVGPLGVAIALAWALGGSSGCAPEPLPSTENAAADTRWNVLVLVPDTVRGDHLSINGYERETTPHLDALARQGINYSRAVTVAPRTWQSFSSILTGLYPPKHGVRFIYDRPISPETPSIASVLAAHGYATAAFDIIPFVRGMTGGHGFDTYVTSVAAGRSEQNAGATPDEILGNEVLAWISAPRETPWFAFVRFSGGHWPYTQGRWAHEYDDCEGCSHAFNLGSAGVKRGAGDQGFVLSDEDAHRRLIWQVDSDEASRTHRIAHYDSELRAVDAVIGDLLAQLRDAGLLERTIVVVTSDHGESFGEHGYLQHGPRVDEPVMHVPLILSLPREHPAHRSGVEQHELVRVIDVFPTLLESLDIAPPPGLEGTSLYDELGREEDGARWAYGESGRSFMGTDPERRIPGVAGKQRMLRTRDWKLVYTPDVEGGRTQLFDLRNDPAEAHDVAAQHPERVAALRARLDDIRAGEAPQAQDRPLSNEEIERLKALGYMQ